MKCVLFCQFLAHFLEGLNFFFSSERILTFLCIPHWQRCFLREIVSNNSRQDKSSEERHFYTHMTCILQSGISLKEVDIGLGWGEKIDKTTVCGPVKGHSA